MKLQTPRQLYCNCLWSCSILKAKLCACVFALVFYCQAAWGAGPFGAGIVLGGLSGAVGLTGEYSYQRHQSWVANLALAYYYRGLQLNHLWYQSDVLKLDRRSSDVDLTTYIGAGLGIHQYRWRDGYFYHRPNGERGPGYHWQVISARMPIGISLMLRKPPIKFFAEIAPSLYVFDDAFLSLEIALGARYFF